MATQPRQVPTRAEYLEGLREARREELLGAALRIVVLEGVSALTIQRLARDVGCAVGLVYRYFASKHALIAQIQREALAVLHESLMMSQQNLEKLIIAREVDNKTAALARPFSAAQFWLRAEETFPNRVELTRRMYTEPTYRITDEDGAGVLAASFKALGDAQRLLDGAVVAGCLQPGSGLERAIIITAGSAGVLMLSDLARWEPALFDGQRLASDMVQALFVGWGADPVMLSDAACLVREFEDRGELVPLVPYAFDFD